MNYASHRGLKSCHATPRPIRKPPASGEGRGLPEVLAEVDQGNTASIAVIERLGMTRFDVVPGQLGQMTRYRRTAGTA
jgi:hypothetical protein